MVRTEVAPEPLTTLRHLDGFLSSNLMLSGAVHCYRDWVLLVFQALTLGRSYQRLAPLQGRWKLRPRISRLDFQSTLKTGFLDYIEPLAWKSGINRSLVAPRMWHSIQASILPRSFPHRQ